MYLKQPYFKSDHKKIKKNRQEVAWIIWPSYM